MSKKVKSTSVYTKNNEVYIRITTDEQVFDMPAEEVYATLKKDLQGKAMGAESARRIPSEPSSADYVVALGVVELTEMNLGSRGESINDPVNTMDRYLRWLEDYFKKPADGPAELGAAEVFHCQLEDLSDEHLRCLIRVLRYENIYRQEKQTSLGHFENITLKHFKDYLWKTVTQFGRTRSS